MNGIIDIEVYTNKIKFKLFSKRKITIINGESGTGKSFLCDLIRKYDSDDSITVKCSYKVVYLESLVDIKGILPFYRNHVVFIDEFSTLLKNQEFLNEILKIDARFIIISRDTYYLNTSYSHKEVYVFRNSGKYITMSSKYNKRVNSNRYSDIVVEDSKSGYNFFNTLFNNVETSFGNDNMVLFLKHKKFNKLYVFDSANFGRQYNQFYEVAIKGLIDLCDIESFEFMLLNSSMLLNSKYSDYIKFPENYGADEYTTWEIYYEKLLKEILYNEVGSKGVYSKNNKCHCLLDDCCYYKNPCNLKSNIKNKYFDILINCGLEYLIKFSVLNDNDDAVSKLRKMFDDLNEYD